MNSTDLNSKVTELTNLLQQFNSPELTIFESPETGYRTRAEFSIWHQEYGMSHVMYRKEGKKRHKIFLNRFPIANKMINQAMALLTKKLRRKNYEIDVVKHKLFQVEYLSNMQAEFPQLIVTLVYHKDLSQVKKIWLKQAKLLQLQLSIACNAQVSIIGRSKKFKIEIGTSNLVQRISTDRYNYLLNVAEGSFSQPNDYINQKMINWVDGYLRNFERTDSLELYCGAGNFTMMLAHNSNKVLATEVTKKAVEIAQKSLSQNNITNTKIIRLSAEELTQAINNEREFKRLRDSQVELGTYKFETILVDPPRSGIDNTSLKFISQFPRIIYISCNPETLCDNLKSLCKTHKIVSSAAFDQFPLTNHLESGVILEKI